MAETVVALDRGLELFAPPEQQTPLKVPGATASGWDKLGIRTVQDLLQHYPRYHVDRTRLKTIAELVRGPEGLPSGEVQLHARVVKIDRPFRTRSGRRMINGRIGDETGSLAVTWFNQDWVARALKPGTEAFFYGKLGRYRGKPQLTAPRFEVVRTGKEPFNVGRIVPVYPATAEVSTDVLRRTMWSTLQSVGRVLDPLPPDLRRKLGLMPRGEALRAIHFPADEEEVMAARRRIVFDEVFTLQLGLVYRKLKLERTVRGIPHPRPGEDSLAGAFVEALPFELTGAQRRASEEVELDMSRRFPMHRLIEGEVGSGKTVVAVYACLVAIGGGHQAAFMAPTEVLAEQHYLTVDELLTRAFGPAEATNLFAATSRRPVVRLLTGSTPARRRREIVEATADGSVDLLIGTHALIQDSVSFARLGVAVVDEQHRFGVHQRKRLRGKGGGGKERGGGGKERVGGGREAGGGKERGGGEPDILVMTATPIPRTLAVTIYGDLDVSILDELPRGRKPITTTIASGQSGRTKAYALIRSEAAAGRQAFVVYALREDSDKSESRSAKAEATRLATEVFPDLRVGLVHGDMPSADKEAAMAAFRDGVTQVLVATTVVEVGVDVPNASVMLIEDAERFGLAQLHQLRGRIGRGRHGSYCILATDLPLERAESEPPVALALDRLRAVAQTSDGFQLALADLRYRGEGELFGARQSGVPQLKMARVLEHRDVVDMARRLATSLLADDPEVTHFANINLGREMRSRWASGELDVVQSG